MRLLSFSVALSLLAVPLSGCWFMYSSSTITTTVGGVSFTLKSSGGSSKFSSSSESSSSAGNGSEQSTHKVQFGDRTIVLGNETDGAMPMTVDGTPHGTVKRGDQVVIDEDGVLTVNGQVRTGE